MADPRTPKRTWQEEYKDAFPYELSVAGGKMRVTSLIDSNGNILKIFIWSVDCTERDEGLPLIPRVKLTRAKLLEYRAMISNEEFKTHIRDHDMLLYHLLWPSPHKRVESFQQPPSPETKEKVEDTKKEDPCNV